MKTNLISTVVTLFIGVILFLICASARAEPRFNALDADDPSYAVYQRNLCEGTLADYKRFYAEKYELDNAPQRFDEKSAEQREDWVVNYVITAKMRDDLLQRYNDNCGGKR